MLDPPPPEANLLVLRSTSDVSAGVKASSSKTHTSDAGTKRPGVWAFGRCVRLFFWHKPRPQHRPFSLISLNLEPEFPILRVFL